MFLNTYIFDFISLRFSAVLNQLFGKFNRNQKIIIHRKKCRKLVNFFLFFLQCIDLMYRCYFMSKKHTFYRVMTIFFLKSELSLPLFQDQFESSFTWNCFLFIYRNDKYWTNIYPFFVLRMLFKIVSFLFYFLFHELLLIKCKTNVIYFDGFVMIWLFKENYWRIQCLWIKYPIIN